MMFCELLLVGAQVRRVVLIKELVQGADRKGSLCRLHQFCTMHFKANVDNPNEKHEHIFKAHLVISTCFHVSSNMFPNLQLNLILYTLHTFVTN